MHEMPTLMAATYGEATSNAVWPAVGGGAVRPVKVDWQAVLEQQANKAAKQVVQKQKAKEQENANRLR